jgi:ectoine utilization protein EutC
MTVTIITGAELKSCVGIDAQAVEVVAEAFASLATGRVVMPPILRLDVPDRNGELDVKTAYVPGLEGFAVKMSSGFFDNPKRGLPSLSGLMVLFDAETGRVDAVLLDNGYLTDVRTAAAGAVAARHLAPTDTRTAGVIGAGLQARLQIEALKLVRDFRRVLVWARDPAKARAYAEEMAARLALPVEPVGDAETVVRGSDVVVTTTPARAPLVEAEWLHEGLHITAMGSDAEDKNELAPEILARADLLVCDRQAQCARLGELHHAVAAGLLREDVPVVELGDLTSGRAPGRRSAAEVTVCDLTGTGVQDTAIALHAYRIARGCGLGTVIEN